MPTTSEKPFVAYRSSAGSGKTFTLVKEYLRLVFSNPNNQYFKHILAITFTNKAANEMRERIIESLEELSGKKAMKGATTTLLHLLSLPKSEGGTGLTKEEIGRKAGNILKHILHNYNHFSISTIDKFTLKVVNAFAPELNIPLFYEVNLNKDELLQRSVELLIEKIGQDKFISNYLIDFAKNQFHEDKSWRINNNIFEIAKNLLKIDDENYDFLQSVDKQDLLNIPKEIRLIIQQKTAQIKVKHNDFLTLIEQNGIQPEHFSRKTFYNYAINFFTLNPKAKYTTPKLEEAINAGVLYPKSVDESIKQILDQITPQLIRLFLQARDLYVEIMGLKQLYKSLYLLPLLKDIQTIFQELKTENHQLTLDDFNELLHNTIKNEPTPFIYERIGEKYRHYLIDEFQDTSVMQWHNLLPLIDNALAENHFNMIVGDAKQAIYRFRGGEIEQFIQLPTIYKRQDNAIQRQQEANLIRTFNDLELNTNYRSGAEIVKFNNRFFDFISGNFKNQSYQELYKNLNQKAIEKSADEDGYVQLSFVTPKKGENFFEIIVPTLIDTIKDLTNKQNYRLKDIAILFRKNKHATLVAEQLSRHGIPIISSESLLLFSDKKVKFLYYFLQLLLNSTARNIQFLTLKYFFTEVKQLSEEKAIMQAGHLLNNPNTNVIDFINQHIAPQNFENLKKLPLYTLIETLIRLFQLNKNANNYLFGFTETVYSFTQKKDTSILAFLEWFDSKIDSLSINTPDNANAITISSIHKAKGLEYPVVLFPFKDNGIRFGNNDYLWVDISLYNTSVNKAPVKVAGTPQQWPILASAVEHEKELKLLDEINTLYVALTRPKEQLLWFMETKKDDIPFKAHEFAKQFLKKKGDEEIYFTGKLPKPTNSIEKNLNQNVIILNTLPVADWTNKVKIAFQAPEIWDENQPKSYTEHGKILHRILSEIKTMNDIDFILYKYEVKGIISKNEISKLKTTITKLFTNPQTKQWFETTNAQNEVPLLLPDGTSYRIDKLVCFNNETHVIDFKTGSKKKSHHQQITNYCSILDEMGYPNVKGFLIYLPDCKVIAV